MVDDSFGSWTHAVNDLLSPNRKGVDATVAFRNTLCAVLDLRRPANCEVCTSDRTVVIVRLVCLNM